MGAPRPRLLASLPRSHPSTAFVFGGGASLGALQVGMLRALYERGIVPDVLVGTSVGALNAGFVASRPQTPATADELAALWRKLRRDHVFPVRPWTIAGGLFARRDHIVPASGLRRLLRAHLEFDDLAAAPVPVHAVAFDLDSGREVLLSAGPAVNALAASAAVPGVLPSVPFAGRRLVDGGVANNTPISHAVALGAERIYVLTTEDPATPRRRARASSALAAGLDGIAVLVGNRLAADLERYADAADIVLLPAPNPLQVQPIDFSHSARLMADATVAARRVLAEGVSRPRRLQRVA
jgi:NTE family protein